MQKKEVLTPLGKPKQGMLWKKVEVNSDFVNVKGGYSAKYHVAPSIMCTVVHSGFHRELGGSTQRKVI